MPKRIQPHLLSMVFVAAMLAQLAFWNYSRHIEPELGIVPDVPGKAAVKALSFGDEQAFFRVLGIGIQNSGDTFGRFTALYKYDMKKLKDWFMLLDTLDNTSNYMPTLATYYFAQTQYKPDVRYIVDYLRSHAEGRIDTKWWWQAQAVYLANHKLKNLDLALELAKPLERARDIPIWAQQLPAFVHEKRGEMESALAIMEEIKNNAKDIPQHELNFMQYFVKERIKHLEKMEKDAAPKP